MIQVYHNPRCRKSREGLAVVESSGQKFEVVKYLDNPLSTNTLEEILSKLKLEPISLVRKNEPIWKTNFKGKELSNKAIIQAMIDYPKLMERPIVVNGDSATVGRPTEKILQII